MRKKKLELEGENWQNLKDCWLARWFSEATAAGTTVAYGNWNAVVDWSKKIALQFHITDTNC